MVGPGHWAFARAWGVATSVPLIFVFQLVGGMVGLGSGPCPVPGWVRALAALFFFYGGWGGRGDSGMGLGGDGGGFWWRRSIL